MAGPAIASPTKNSTITAPAAACGWRTNSWIKPRKTCSRPGLFGELGTMEVGSPGEWVNIYSLNMFCHHAKLGKEIRNNYRSALDQDALYLSISVGPLGLIQRGSSNIDQTVQLLIAEVRFIPFGASPVGHLQVLLWSGT